MCARWAAPLEAVMDAIDIETFVVCDDDEEAKKIGLALAQHMGLPEGDIVFVEKLGPGARIRIRGYLHRPGDSYRWLRGVKADDCCSTTEEGNTRTA